MPSSRTRYAGLPLSLCAAVALVALAARPAAASEPAPRYPSHLDGTPEELAAFTLADTQKYIKAREIAEKIIKVKPQSWAGHYVLGVAMHYGEGDLARSVYHLDESARLFEAKYGDKPPDDAPWRWHELALRELAYALNEIDEPARELGVLERHDVAYSPKRPAQRIWPLMKLRRYDEARRAARLAIASGQADQQLTARADLCAAECEAGDREAAWKACVDALTIYREAGFGGQIEFSNASESAQSVFRFDDAERYLHEAIRRASSESWGNPYQQLALLLLAEGRVPEAIAALKDGQELRMKRPAWLDQHGQARLDWTVATLLLIVGQTERAVQIAERADARPDRQGVHSGTEAQATAASELLLALALREQAARDAEDAVTSGFGGGIKLRWRALRGRVAAWQAARRAAVTFADPDFLERTLRPYYVGGADVTQWLVPEVIDIVGAGVALKAIDGARAVEKFGASPAYLDALEAEARWRVGDWDAASAAAERALARLPRAEVLLAGRVAAVAFDAARRRGDPRAAAHLSMALTKDPGVLRRLDIRLPVTVRSDGSDVAEVAQGLIESSPRFDVGDGAHSLALRGGGDADEACLLGPNREVLQCARMVVQPNLTPKDRARRLVAELHRAAFAYKADLGQSDLSSLDGSPTVARADRQVKSLLDSLGPADPAQPQQQP